MKLHRPNAELFIPDQLPVPEALSRVTHLGVGAHQDDLEFMAYHGILACYGKADSWFAGVTCTNGHGSSRIGAYASCTDEQLGRIRRAEQNNAAIIGQYGAMFQLDYTSAEINDTEDSRLKEDLIAILQATRPQIVYTHNPADKHRTHLGVMASLIAAIRSLPAEERPASVWGCEVWRNLDWMPDEEKILMDVTGHDNLAAAINGVFDSQIAGGKRYDLAIAGRRAANATFHDPHATDASTGLILGMDLTPLTRDDGPDPIEYVCGFIDRFRTDVRNKLSAQFPR
jgi:LmbE family N-acetylglucosaminyl deacetylase